MKPIATAPVILYDANYDSFFFSLLYETFLQERLVLLLQYLISCALYRVRNKHRHRLQCYYWYVASALTSLMKIADPVRARTCTSFHARDNCQWNNSCRKCLANQRFTQCTCL